MKKKLLPLLLLPFSLVSCGEKEESATEVRLHFGTTIGLNEAIGARTHLTFIKRGKLNSLISSGESFLFLLHGSSDTCTCYTDFHANVLVPYIKANKLLIYAMDLKEFESEGEYYGITRYDGSETLAIFRDGKLAYQHSNADDKDPWGYDFPTFSSYMNKRIINPRIYFIDEDDLDAKYASTLPFTIYFGRLSCPDCAYLERTSLRQYIDDGKVREKEFYYFDVDPYRPTDFGDEGQVAAYNAVKEKYGLVESEDNPAGFSGGVFPTIYYVNPDGAKKKGDVIEASGVFYNDTIADGKITESYFSEARLNKTPLGYLRESKVGNKVLEGIEIGEVGPAERHDKMRVYEEPILNALLDFAVGGN